MKIKLLKPCVVAGHIGSKVGDVLIVTPHVYQVLEGLGAAEVVPDNTPALPPTGMVQPPGIIEHRDPEPETRDPEMKKGRRQKAEG